LAAVWSDAIVVDSVLKVTVLEIRKALGETGRERGFIETLHRRGYRFRAAETAAAADPHSAAPPAAAAPAGPPVPRPAAPPRPPAPPPRNPAPPPRAGPRRGAAEWLRPLLLAGAGRRRVVFVPGEAGDGKSSRVELLRRELGRAPPLCPTGQCNGMVGQGEP